MSVLIKSKLIKEDIVDEEGNVLGEIKFNPNDTRIVNKLSKIMVDIQNMLEKAEEMGDIPQIYTKKIDKLEEFQATAEVFEKINQVLTLEEESATQIINDLSEILGRETVEIFTEGTLDLNTLHPLLDCIIPYIKEARERKLDAYIGSSDVMD